MSWCAAVETAKHIEALLEISTWHPSCLLCPFTGPLLSPLPFHRTEDLLSPLPFHWTEDLAATTGQQQPNQGRHLWAYLCIEDALELDPKLEEESLHGSSQPGGQARMGTLQTGAHPRNCSTPTGSYTVLATYDPQHKFPAKLLQSVQRTVSYSSADKVEVCSSFGNSRIVAHPNNDIVNKW